MKDNIKGLTPETAKIFEEISELDCIKDLWLCGGTSISLQIGNRLSEDLDFELIDTKQQRPGLSFNVIINEIADKFPGATKEILSDSHFQMFLGNVKLSFFRPSNPVPSLSAGLIHNNLKTPSLQELLGMKIYTTSVRTVFRDYYDIYCLLKEGMDFEQGVKYACDFSRHTLHTKTIFATLTTPRLFPKEDDFDDRLNPRYNITADEICELIKNEIVNFQAKKNIRSLFSIFDKEHPISGSRILENIDMYEGTAEVRYTNPDRMRMIHGINGDVWEFRNRAGELCGTYNVRTKEVLKNIQEDTLEQLPTIKIRF